jgi:dephospho-CoA kinase
VGLIGGIASGKSLASSHFKALGIEVIDSDQIARDIVMKGSPLLQSIANHFGQDVLQANGDLNRAQLRIHIFANPHERLWLENLMHPVIRQKIDAAIDAAKSPYCVVAIPLLKRREDYPRLKKILLIDAPAEMQLKRLITRDHIPAEFAQSIIDAQSLPHERLALADVVIINDGDEQALCEKIKDFDQTVRSSL